MQCKLAQSVPEGGLCLQVPANKMLLAGFGETFSEARASTLLQLPFHPRDLTEEEREGANITAIVLHGAVYSARPDVACVLHTHSPYATALAAADVEFNPEIMQVRCTAPFAWPLHHLLSSYVISCRKQSFCSLKSRSGHDFNHIS
jgi:hypothetical protein